MHVMFRLPPLAALLLLAAAPFAGAESPMPDPIAPAVVGRPLDQIRSGRAQRHKPVAAKPVRRQQLAAARQVVRTRAPVTAALGAGPAPQAAAAPQVAPPTQVAGVASPGMRLVTRLFGPGNYFSSKDQVLVRMYYDAHPAPSQAPRWKAGEAIPMRAELTGVPDGLRGALSALPRGHQYEYVQLDGEVVLVAVQSRTVLDGISRGLR